MTAKIRLAEGGGGQASADLIRNVFWSRLAHPELLRGNDAAVLKSPGETLAFSTDSFVITPWQFPGGDIGRLAVCGTVNDLAVMGAKPAVLSVSFIIEEGFNLPSLEMIAQSLADTAAEAGVSVVCGDTKVVNKGAADGIFITTSGIGAVLNGIRLGGENAQPGDAIIITGTIGDHGAAVMLARGELNISGNIKSDVAPLNNLLIPLLEKFADKIKVIRDPTRGGLAVALNEIARQSRVSLRIIEHYLPIKPEVKGISGLLGLDPLYLANEGKAVIICNSSVATDVLTFLQKYELGREARLIGEVTAEKPGLVTACNEIGGERILPMGSGENLPRIC